VSGLICCSRAVVSPSASICRFHPASTIVDLRHPEAIRPSDSTIRDAKWGERS
jgi:hypothetical protein